MTVVFRSPWKELFYGDNEENEDGNVAASIVFSKVYKKEGGEGKEVNESLDAFCLLV